MNATDHSAKVSANQTRAAAEAVAQSYYAIEKSKVSPAQMVYRYLLGAVWALLLMPTLFYLRFGTIGAFGWVCTIFLIGLCLLSALGFYFIDRPEYHTTVALKNNWLDKIGGFWLVAC